MTSRPGAPTAVRAGARKKRDAGPLKNFWRKARTPLAQSRFAKGAIATMLTQWLRIVKFTNPLAEGSADLKLADAELAPAIVALWHGQHLMAPTIYPRGRMLVAMVSRSADAELNALVIEKFGLEAVRGSGGRVDKRHLDKGGARALIALKKALDAGKNVCMIADIPHGTPREAGLGIVTLARLSGRPIVPVAITTSRRRVVEKSWDKTAINLPFGRCGIAMGEPVHVSADASAAELELKRQEVTDSLNRATEGAYRLVDGGR